MAVNLSPIGGVAGQFFTNNGTPLSGGKIYTYAAGSSTPATTYTTAAGNVAHTNPIVLDSGGRVPTGEIWLTDGVSYKFVIKTSADVLIGTYDNIVGINSNFVNYTNQQDIQTATAGQTLFTLPFSYAPGTNSLSVFVDGVNQYGPGAQYAYVETSSTEVTFTNGLHVGAEVKFTTSQLNSSSAGDASQISFTGFKGQVGNVQDLAGDDGSDWIGFLQAGTGAVAISAQDKMRQTASVKDFGAVGDGVVDDTAALQAAINTGKPLQGLAGNIYKITATLTSSTGLIFNGNGCEIKVYGDIDALDLSGSDGNYPCNISNVTFNSNGSPLTATNSGIIGDVSGIFSNVRVQFFQTGFNFTTNSFLLTVNNCTAYACITGFKSESTTQSSTTNVFDRCYALTCGTGFRLVGISDGELRNCAIDVGVGGDYAIPCNNAISTDYLGSFNFYATHIEGLPNPVSYFNCFDITNQTGALNIIGTLFDIYENATITRLFYVSGYSAPYGRLNIIGSKQTPKNTMPTIVRYSLRTDDPSYKLYVYSLNNSFIDTNCTIRVGSDGSGNVGESWLSENNTITPIPTLYKLSGTSSGVVEPSNTNSIHTYSSETTVTSGGPANAFIIEGGGMWLVSTFVGASGTNYRAVSVVTSDGTTADITAIKTASQVTLGISGLTVQISLTGGASGIVQYRALKIG